MSLDFLREFGFTQDPFASTNAADEPLIGKYFVEPPFFPAVVGDPVSPKSNVVFAPRGGGKTAQKIMIERKSAGDGSFLCISYDQFPLEGIPRDKNAPSEYHLSNISRTLLIAILIKIESDESVSKNLDQADRKLIVDCARQFLGSITSTKFKESLGSIKSISDKSSDLWSKYGGLVIDLVNAISVRYGFGKLDNVTSIAKDSEGSRFKFISLIGIARKIGYNSTYILVDRVDEIVFAARDAEKAFHFLESLLIDLPLLETPGAAFKFFLWDQMKEHYQEAGGRPDRLIEYTLDWTVEDLEKVLERRLLGYSDGKVKRFDEMLSSDCPYRIHSLVAYFAHGSPRDMVRICKKIVDEHTKSGKFANSIDFRTVKSALLSFSLERAKELYGQHVTEIRKIGSLNFTISLLANDVFRVSQQAARSKVQKWLASGAVVKIGDVPNPGNRPQYLYGVVDPRLAIVGISEMTIEDVVENYLLICPHCSALRIAEEGEITCPDCQGNFRAEDASNLYDVIKCK